MDFGTNKTPVEIIKEGAFGGTYFRDVYSGVNSKWYKNSWKEFDVLENIDQKYYCSDYYDVKMWCIIKIDPYGWFQWYFKYYLGRRSKYDKRQINRWKRIVSRFKDKLIEMMEKNW